MQISALNQSIKLKLCKYILVNYINVGHSSEFDLVSSSEFSPSIYNGWGVIGLGVLGHQLSWGSFPFINPFLISKK